MALVLHFSNSRRNMLPTQRSEEPFSFSFTSTLRISADAPRIPTAQRTSQTARIQWQPKFAALSEHLSRAKRLTVD